MQEYMKSQTYRSLAVKIKPNRKLGLETHFPALPSCRTSDVDEFSRGHFDLSNNMEYFIKSEIFNITRLRALAGRPPAYVFMVGSLDYPTRFCSCCI